MSNQQVKRANHDRPVEDNTRTLSWQATPKGDIFIVFGTETDRAVIYSGLTISHQEIERMHIATFEGGSSHD